MPRRRPVIEFTPKGLYIPAARAYIDPWRPVGRAIITHAHSDHARWGHQRYLAHPDSEGILRLRLGDDIQLQTLPYGQPLKVGRATISLHPAGHIVGSAQVRVAVDGEVWVVSGDYKTEPDGHLPPFEAVKCHTFISECTFGLPIYHWRPQSAIFEEVNAWWQANAAEGKVSVLAGYALGKAQRLLQGVDPQLGPIFVHGAVHNVNEVLALQGVALPPTTLVTQEIPKADYRGALVVAPPSAFGTPWMRKFQPYSTAFASGWMNLRGAKRRRAADRGFVLSDHADWPGLLDAVAATGAERVYATHGYTAVFARYLAEQGLDAREVPTQFGGEGADEESTSQTSQNTAES